MIEKESGRGINIMTEHKRRVNKIALLGFILEMLSVTLLVFCRFISGELITWLLILSLFVLSPIGFVFSIVGLILSIKNKDKGKGFAISAIVISVLKTIFVIYIFLFVLYLGMSGGPNH
ncbi:MAG: hypothetical protein IKQ00_08825 [Butyrivibrio sp.]|nr:hypothetical protein [Butyrivibrio sp.]